MLKQTYFHRVSAQTPTRFWINNVTPEEAGLALEAGAVGCTQNPAYTWKMINHPDAADQVSKRLDAILKDERDDNEAIVKLQRELVGEIARIFMPLYEKSFGKDGYVSIQGDPFHEDADTILRHARENTRAFPNIMAKVPVTKEGLEAIEVLISEGIPINATEVMSVRQAMDVCRIYKKAAAGMKNPPVVLFSHIAGIFDEYIKAYSESIKAEVPRDYLWQAGAAVARKIDALVHEGRYNVGFISGGARGLHHFTEMVGCECFVTINWQGTADELIKHDLPVVQRFLQPTPHSVIDTLCTRLPDFKKAYFESEIEQEEYEEFGPVVLFRKNFEAAWAGAVDFSAKRRAAIKA